jgi:transmembrane protein TMEM174 (potassium channel)
MGEAQPNSRLETFRDGVFAVALTLLIIDVKIPASQATDTGQTMSAKRIDDHHYTGVVKPNGQPYLTSNATLSSRQTEIWSRSLFLGLVAWGGIWLRGSSCSLTAAASDMAPWRSYGATLPFSCAAV